MKIRDRIKKFRRVKASELRPNPRNWRTHPEEQRDALRAVLAEIGMADVLLARELPDGTLELIDGHLRAETMPDQMVPVVVLDVTQAEAEKIMLTLDPLAAMADADTAALALLLGDVETDSEALGELLTDLAESYELEEPESDELPADPGAKMSHAAELQKKWRTAAGQTWSLGPHRLLIDDATSAEAMARFFGDEQADLVWVDPPYGVAYEGKTADRLTIENDALSPDELEVFLDRLLSPAFDVCRAGAAWYVAAPSGPQFLAFAKVLTRLGVWRQTLVWVKDTFVMGHSDYHYQHESIFYGWKSGKHQKPRPRPEGDALDYLYRQQAILYGWKPGAAHQAVPDRRQHSVFEVDRPQRSLEHPTMKPPELVVPMLRNSSRRGQLVLDSCLGSGTTMVAAQQIGRRCWGVEQDAAYAAVVLERLAGMGCVPQLEKPPSKRKRE